MTVRTHVPLRERSPLRRTSVAGVLTTLAALSFVVGTQSTPGEHEKSVETAPVQAEETTGKLLSSPAPLPVGYQVASTTRTSTAAAVEVADTGNVVVLHGLPDTLQKGDEVALWRAEELPEGADLTGATLDGTWVRAEAWEPVALEVDAPLKARALGMAAVLTLCMIVPLLLLVSAYTYARPPRVVRELQTKGLALDPHDGIRAWKALQEKGAPEGLGAATLLAVVVTGFLAVTVGGALLTSGGTGVAELWAMFALSAGAVVVGGGVLWARGRLLEAVAQLQRVALLPAPPEQPAWVLTLPEGRRARAHLARTLDEGALEAALVLAREGAVTSVGDLARAARAL